jgi:hypothetical protein
VTGFVLFGGVCGAHFLSAFWTISVQVASDEGSSAGSRNHAFAAITVNGAGGTVQQQDNLSINAFTGSILTLTTGTPRHSQGARG